MKYVTNEKPIRYKILDLPLIDKVTLSIQMFSYDEHRWFLTHEYQSPEELGGGQEPEVISKTQLTVNYRSGRVEKCDLFLYLIFPDPQESKEYNYTLSYDHKTGGSMETSSLKLERIQRGVRNIELDELHRELGELGLSEFPVSENVYRVGNDPFRIPFLRDGTDLCYFRFPAHYVCSDF